MLKILWNVIAGIAVLSGIYQGYVAYKTPRPVLSLVQATTSFEMPSDLDPVFDQLDDEEKSALARNQAYVAKNSPLRSITHAGLHNTGEKTATDIRVTFPNARVISVRADGKKNESLRGQTQVTIDKLPPSSSVYFVVWGRQEDRSGAEQSISAVHSEGLIEISDPSSGRFIDEGLKGVLFVLIGMLVSCGLFVGYLHLRPKDAAPAQQVASR